MRSGYSRGLPAVGWREKASASDRRTNHWFSILKARTLPVEANVRIHSLDTSANFAAVPTLTYSSGLILGMAAKSMELQGIGQAAIA